MKKTSHNKTYSLRLETLECRQMLSVMGVGTDETATNFAQEAVASYNVNNEYASVEASLMSLAAETSTVDTWDGSADTSWWDTKAEGQTEFTLTTAEELAGLAQLVNSQTAFCVGTSNLYSQDYTKYTIKLGADIDLTGYDWTPIGGGGVSYDGTLWNKYDYTSAFRGTFDGQGHTISNLTINASHSLCGLFGHIEDANIGNFKMTNVSINGGRFTGAVAGKGIYDYSMINIHDVEITGVNITGTGDVAGILGNSDTGHSDNLSSSIVQDCKVIGIEGANTIQGSRYGSHIGGIAGYNQSGIITGCTVENINLKGGSWIGGIAGNARSPEYEGQFEFNGNVAHKNNTVSDVNITTTSETFVGAMFGIGSYFGDGEDTGNTFQNVTITANNVSQLIVMYGGTSTYDEGTPPLESQVDIQGTPIAQIYDTKDNTYASFSTLEEALNNYDAKSEGKRVVLLADVTLTENLNIPEGVTLDTNGYTINTNGGDITIEITEDGGLVINGTTINSNGGAKLEVAEDGSIQYIAGEGDTITTADGEVISLIAGQEIKFDAEGQIEKISAVISHSGNYVIFHLGQIADAKYSFQMKKSTASSWTTFSGVTFDENGYATVKVTSSKFSRGVQYDYRILANGKVNINGILTVENAASTPAVTVTSYTSNDDAKVLTITSATKLDLAYNVKVKSAWKATTANSTYVPSVTETVNEDGTYTYVITLSTDVQSLKLTYNTAYTYGDDILTLASSRKSTTWALN